MDKKIWIKKKIDEKIFVPHNNFILTDEGKSEWLYFGVVDENDAEYRKHFGIKKPGKQLQLVIPKSNETFNELINKNSKLRNELQCLKKKNKELKRLIEETTSIVEAIMNPKTIMFNVDEKFIL